MSDDGVKYYCKYKVRPQEDIPESGTNEDTDMEDAGNQRILPHETRGKNFLKNEYMARVKNGGAKYTLQIQLRLATDDDDIEIFNNMKPWDETSCPWLDLAEFEVTEILDWKESTKTTFSLKNMPKSLGIIPAKSIYDYNSLNYIRAQSHIARKARLFAYKLWGMVPPIPDNDERNITVWTNAS
jgi:arachidonate 5-lipoxygenase